MPMCPKFTKFAEDLARMDDLGKQSDKPDKGEVFRALTRVSGSVMGMAADIGQLNQLRNEALLAHRMGLGEYTWLYVLAYHSWLGNPVPDSADEDDGDGDGDGPRVEKLRALVIGMMRRYAEAEAAAGRADQATLWRTEADRMEGAAAENPVRCGRPARRVGGRVRGPRRGTARGLVRAHGRVRARPGPQVGDVSPLGVGRRLSPGPGPPGR
jgi:hypothetical protein